MIDLQSGETGVFRVNILNISKYTAHVQSNLYIHVIFTCEISIEHSSAVTLQCLVYFYTLCSVGQVAYRCNELIYASLKKKEKRTKS